MRVVIASLYQFLLCFSGTAIITYLTKDFSKYTNQLPTAPMISIVLLFIGISGLSSSIWQQTPKAYLQYLLLFILALTYYTVASYLPSPQFYGDLFLGYYWLLLVIGIAITSCLLLWYFIGNKTQENLILLLIRNIIVYFIISVPIAFFIITEQFIQALQQPYTVSYFLMLVLLALIWSIACRIACLVKRIHQVWIYIFRIYIILIACITIIWHLNTKQWDPYYLANMGLILFLSNAIDFGKNTAVVRTIFATGSLIGCFCILYYEATRLTLSTLPALILLSGLSLVQIKLNFMTSYNIILKRTSIYPRESMISANLRYLLILICCWLCIIGLIFSH